jgi:hypothetical protein
MTDSPIEQKGKHRSPMKRRKRRRNKQTSDGDRSGFPVLFRVRQLANVGDVRHRSLLVPVFVILDVGVWCHILLHVRAFRLRA